MGEPGAEALNPTRILMVKLHSPGEAGYDKVRTNAQFYLDQAEDYQARTASFVTCFSGWRTLGTEEFVLSQDGCVVDLFIPCRPT